MDYCVQVIVVYCHGLQERPPTAGSAGVADFSLIDVFFFSGFRAVTFVLVTRLKIQDHLYTPRR